MILMVSSVTNSPVKIKETEFWFYNIFEGQKLLVLFEKETELTIHGRVLK